MSNVDHSSQPSGPTVSQHPLLEMLKIAGPTVATMTSYTLMIFVDSLLVSSIGPEPIYVGAQGNGGLLAWVAISFAHGTVTVINTFVSQNMGAGRPERGPAYVWNGMWIALSYWLVVLVPLAFGIRHVYEFLEAHGGVGQGHGSQGMDPRQAALSAQYAKIMLLGAVLTMFTRAASQFFFGMHRAGIVLIAGVVANVCNLLFNCVLIYGNGPMPEAFGLVGRVCHGVGVGLGVPPMGLAGSAYGTLLATLVELAIPMSVFLSAKLNAAYRTRTAWRPSLSHIKQLLGIGIPSGLMFFNEMVCWAFFMTVLVSSYGEVHATAAWAAHRYMQLSFMPVVGVSIACTALVGKYIGMGRHDVAEHRAWLGVKLAAGYMGCCGLVFVLFPTALITPYIPDGASPETREMFVRLGTKFLIATATFQLFDGAAMVLSGALRGAGDTKFPGIATCVLSWTLIVGGGFAMRRFVPQLESVGPWIAAAAYIFALSLMLVVRFRSGRWRQIKLMGDGARGDDRGQSVVAAEAAVTDGM